jgi:hypothetical protein
MRVLQGCWSALQSDDPQSQIGRKIVSAVERQVTASVAGIGCRIRRFGHAAGLVPFRAINEQPSARLATSAAAPDEMPYVREWRGGRGMKIEDSIRGKTGNRLLAALPSEVWQDLKPHLELVDLAPDQVLCASGK